MGERTNERTPSLFCFAPRIALVTLVVVAVVVAVTVAVMQPPKGQKRTRWG